MRVARRMGAKVEPWGPTVLAAESATGPSVVAKAFELWQSVQRMVDVVVNHVGPGSMLVGQQPTWFRTGSQCGSDDVTMCLAGLPDFPRPLLAHRAQVPHLPLTQRVLKKHVLPALAKLAMHRVHQGTLLMLLLRLGRTGFFIVAA